MNNPHKEAGQSEFFDEARANTNAIFFRVRNILGPEEDINAAETRAIVEDDSVRTGYNKNYGGGGGNQIDSEAHIISSKPIEPITPVKTYPLVRRVTGEIDIETTPGVESKKNVIYFFRHKRKLTEYVGYTTENVKGRNTKHRWTFNHPEKEAGQKLLPQAVQQSPAKFIFGVYGTVEQMGESLGPHETHCQTVKNTLAPAGLNVRKGNGGGVCKNFGK